MGELQPVHRTRHVNVGKDETDIVANSENGDGLVRIAGLENVKSRRLDGSSGTRPDQIFVLDDEHDRPLAGIRLHEDRCLCWAEQGSRSVVYPTLLPDANTG